MRPRQRKRASVAPALSLVLLLSGGCGSALPSYSLRTYWPHKDIAVVSIYVEERLDPDEYLAIVEMEKDRLLANPLPSEVPVYEVRFEFYLPDSAPPMRKRVAEVSVRPGNGVAPSPASERPTVVLY